MHLSTREASCTPVDGCAASWLLGYKAPVSCYVVNKQATSIAGIEADRFQSNPCTSVRPAVCIMDRCMARELVARVPVVLVS